MPQRAWLERLPFSAAWRNNWTAAARIRRHGHAALGHACRADTARSASRRRRLDAGSPPPGPAGPPSSRVACQRQGIAERALRAAGGGRALVPAMRLVRIAHRLRSGGQDVAEHRLAVGGTAFGRLARPASAGLEIRRRRLGGGEQPGATIRYPRLAVQPVDRKGGKLRLRLDIALVGRPLEPARAFRPARRHAGAFQIAAAHPVFRLGDAGARGAAPAAGRPAWHCPCSISRTARRNAAADESATGRRSRRAIALIALPPAEPW